MGIAYLLCLPAAASATPVVLDFEMREEGRVEFSQAGFSANQPIEGVHAHDSQAVFGELTGRVQVQTGKVRRTSTWSSDGTGHYAYGRANLTLFTDHGNFTAHIRQLSFDLELLEPEWREILPTDFVLTRPKYDPQLAAYLGVQRTATRADWGIYADGFFSYPGSIDDGNVLLSRIYPGGSGLTVYSVLRPTAPVPEPSTLLLTGVAAVIVVWQRRRQR
jgi:hypothetical protein